MNEKTYSARPSVAQIDAELKRLSDKEKRRQTASRVMITLIVVAAVTVLVATLWLPMLQVVGTSMAPTLADGEIVFVSKSDDNIVRGDLIAFYYNDKALIKRVIGLPGDEVSIDDDGNIFVNGTQLDEPYVHDKSLGQVSVEFPVTVGSDSYFVLGDNRQVSMDSRSYELGNIHSERIVGEVILRVYPINRFGAVD